MNEVLARAGIFQGIAPDAVDALARHLEHVVFPRRRTVFVEGEPGNDLYVILSGSSDLAEGHVVAQDLDFAASLDQGRQRVVGEGGFTASSSSTSSILVRPMMPSWVSVGSWRPGVEVVEIFLNHHVAATGEGGILIADERGDDFSPPCGFSVPSTKPVRSRSSKYRNPWVSSTVVTALPSSWRMSCEASSKHRSMRSARMWKKRSPGVAGAQRGPLRSSRKGCSSAGRGAPNSRPRSRTRSRPRRSGCPDCRARRPRAPGRRGWRRAADPGGVGDTVQHTQDQEDRGARERRRYRLRNDCFWFLRSCRTWLSPPTLSCLAGACGSRPIFDRNVMAPWLARRHQVWLAKPGPRDWFAPLRVPMRVAIQFARVGFDCYRLV